MKKNPEPIPASAQDKKSLVLQKAHALMNMYAKATGACICIHDRNFMPIPELFDEMLDEKNICLFCIRYRKQTEVKNLYDLSANPCREMHINAIRESHRFGGTYTYICPLGFMFWTSPIYLDGHFSGALTASGFLGTDAGGTCAKMREICKGAADETELKQMLSRFPRTEPRKIKALAELLLVCAQSLSAGSEGCHDMMKRRAEQQADISAKIADLKNHYTPGSPPPEYPLDKERELLKALRQGDAESGRKILGEILALLFLANSDQFRNIQYRAIELAVLLSRMDTGTGFAAGAVPETNNQYIKSVQDTNDIEELTDALYQIVDDIAGQILSFQGIQHGSALKKAEHFIAENFTRKISLDEIAKASGFSAPYFSTVFKDEMGENLSSYLNRLRVERAGYMLTDTNYSLSKIARACGFEDQSWFSKIFKAYTGISPGKYRGQGGKQSSKIPGTGFSDDYLQMIGR